MLERDVNPSIAAHGGHAELVAIDGAIAYLRLGGGCQGCGMATVTLSQGIEVAITEAVPEIDAIVDVTDHASGGTPTSSRPRSSRDQGRWRVHERSLIVPRGHTGVHPGLSLSPATRHSGARRPFFIERRNGTIV